MQQNQPQDLIYQLVAQVKAAVGLSDQAIRAGIYLRF
jgi:hypothetical protein